MKTSRRDFLHDSLILACSTLFLPSSFPKEEAKALPIEREELREYPSYLKLYQNGALSQRTKKLYEIYENCHLCPQDCRVNRLEGQKGKCQSTSKVKVADAFTHYGEEAPLVGKRGSGTIFFSNCGLRCVFCQNYKINIEGEGVEISDDQLAELMIKVQRFGCHNINLVTPTHYVPNIVNALEKAIPRGFNIPLVYNTGGYEHLEILQLLEGIIDIYLPDLKFMDPEQAAKYQGYDTYNYPHYAKIAVKEMFRQVGDLLLERGIAVRGLILRHLVMPNRVSGTEEFLKYVAENLSKTTYLNLMNQYRPEYKAFEYPKIARRLKREEYAEAVQWARKYGLTRLAR